MQYYFPIKLCICYVRVLNEKDVLAANVRGISAAGFTNSILLSGGTCLAIPQFHMSYDDNYLSNSVDEDFLVMLIGLPEKPADWV